MDQPTPTAPTFAAAEQTFAHRLGLELRERFVHLPGPISRARVLETGDGPPLVFVHGGGGFSSQCRGHRCARR